MCKAMKEIIDDARFNELCDLVKENIITIEIAADRMHMSIDEFSKRRKERKSEASK